MKASDYIAGFLESQGVTVVFEVIGGMITHLIDSLHQSGKIRIVSLHHEQGAAFAVDGFGRMQGQPAVAMATSGPGATNLLTGIGSCYFDSVPAVFITGQVNRHELRGERAVRQLGFQETDIVAMARPVTKAAWAIEQAEEIPQRLREAFALACSGRPGPVLLDIPMDLQRVDLTQPLVPWVAPAGSHSSASLLPDHFLSSLAGARRPLVIAGSGAAQTPVRTAVRAALEQLNVPVVCSLLGNDLLPARHPLRVGFHGSYGNRWANHAIGSADWLLVLGSRLDIRQTGADVESFRSGKRIFHVDVDPAEINNRVIGCTPIVADTAAFARALQNALQQPSRRPDTTAWRGEIAANRDRWPPTAEYRTREGINPCAFIQAVSEEAGCLSAWVADVGQHQMWAAQCLQLHEGQRFLTSGGMGAMGYALPAAIGVALQSPGRPVGVIAGDGGFQLNLQELQTVVRNRLPIKMVIINNHCHGMVRQFQESYFAGRFRSTLWGYSAPDFAALAAAYGIAAETLREPADTRRGLDFLWRDPLEPALLQVMISPLGNVYPKIAFGHPLTAMEPEVAPLEMEGT